MRSISVTFRGYTSDVVVDAYHDDVSTNATEIEWHFDGLTPDDHDDLHVSDEENEQIERQLFEALHERSE